MYAVIYFGVDMVRSAGNYNYRHIFESGFLNDPLTFFDYFITVLFQRLMTCTERFLCLFFGNSVFFAESVYQYFNAVAFKIYVNIGEQEIAVGKLGDISFEKFGIICDNRAVIMIVALPLVYIVAFAGVENEVRASQG